MEHFKILSEINVNDYVEQKEKLTYLPWADAWAKVKSIYPDADYDIDRFEGRPYYYDELTGYMVSTWVEIEGKKHKMWLPVLDEKNKAMKSAVYTYPVKEKVWDDAKKKYVYTGKIIDKSVEAATMADINKALMRCLVKNLAMFGLGLYIYRGEEEPECEKGKHDEMFVDDGEHCQICGKPLMGLTLTDGTTYTKEQMKQESLKRYNKFLCYTCLREAKKGAKNEG